MENYENAYGKICYNYKMEHIKLYQEKVIGNRCTI